MTRDTRDRLADADWLHLTDGEEIRWTGRPSRYTIAASLIVAGALVVAGVAITFWLVPLADGGEVPDWLGFAPLLLTLYGVVRGTATYLNWRRHLYVITDEGVYVRYGLVSRDITQVPIDRVQNSSFDQSMLQRALSFGDVHIFTAGSSTEDLTFENVPNPHVVSEALTVTQSEQRERQQEPRGAV